MGSFSNTTEDQVLDHIVGKTTFALPTTVAISLCTADPTDAGTGASQNEVANANGYARVDTVGADWNASSGGAIDNANDLTFPEATGSWSTVTHFAGNDSASYGSGDMLWHGSISPTKLIQNGDTPRFAAGDLDITLD